MTHRKVVGQNGQKITPSNSEIKTNCLNVFFIFKDIQANRKSCWLFLFIFICMKSNIRTLIRKVISENFSSMIDEIEVAQGLDLSQDDLNEILKGYLEAALWTEEERLKDDYDSEYGYNEDEYNDDDDEESELDKLIRIQTQFNAKPFESFVTEDLEGDSKVQAYLDIKKFIQLAGKDAVEEAINDQGLFRLGMDIWLTRNGHGSGFFDHSYDYEKELMDAGHSLKSVDLYITDDLTLAFSNA